jgi:hypothetical protein
MSTTNAASSAHRLFLSAALAVAALASFGCASAAGGAADAENAMGTATVPGSATRPRFSGDACAHTEPGIYANETDGGPSRRVGGECHYDETEGYVVVTAIDEAPADAYNCAMHPRRVAVTFYDANGNAIANDDMRNAYGANPPLHCLESEGIRIGAHFPATRAVITSGTCSPTVLRIHGEFGSCDTGCF